MTFKEFARAVAYLPATIFSGMVNLLLGNTKKDSHGKVALDKEEKAKINPGLLGLVLGGISLLGRVIADFFANHKKAIATAFWASLILGGAAALTVFLWPAALTAIATFSVFGLSIAGIVGANTALQIGAIAGLAFTATSLTTYLVAGVVNTISAIIDCFKRPSESSNDDDDEDSDENTIHLSEDTNTDANSKTSASSMSKLSTATATSTKTVTASDLRSNAPVHTTQVFSSVTPITTESTVSKPTATVSSTN